MNTHIYHVEEPVEGRIDNVVQISQPKPALPSARDVGDPMANWRLDGKMTDLGMVVACERPDGSMASSTWVGETETVWASFDIDPTPPLRYMRQHMLEAVAIDQPRPAGFLRVRCFKRQSYEKTC